MLFPSANDTRHQSNQDTLFSLVPFDIPNCTLKRHEFYFNAIYLEKNNVKWNILVANATALVNGIDDSKSFSSSPTSNSNTFHSGFSLNLLAITQPPTNYNSHFNIIHFFGRFHFYDQPVPAPTIIKSTSSNVSVSYVSWLNALAHFTEQIIDTKSRTNAKFTLIFAIRDKIEFIFWENTVDISATL